MRVDRVRARWACRMRSARPASRMRIRSQMSSVDIRWAMMTTVVVPLRSAIDWRMRASEERTSSAAVGSSSTSSSGLRCQSPARLPPVGVGHLRADSHVRRPRCVGRWAYPRCRRRCGRLVQPHRPVRRRISGRKNWMFEFDAPRQQQGVLRDEGSRRRPRAPVDVFHVHVTDRRRSRADRPQAEQQFDKCRLATAGRADDPDDLTRLDRHAHVVGVAAGLPCSRS